MNPQEIPMPDEKRFIKIGADGAQLPDDATEWKAVLDTRSGLMWTKADVKIKNWKKADAAATAMTAGGFSDWRLPTVEELFLLADRTRAPSPAIDAEYFPDCKSDWYWSSTPYARSPGVCAWVVYFLNGSADWYDHDNHGFVRAVRPGQ
jgi:hypothetical protein